MPREKYVRAARGTPAEHHAGTSMRLTTVNRDFYLQESRIDSVTHPPVTFREAAVDVDCPGYSRYLIYPGRFNEFPFSRKVAQLHAGELNLRIELLHSLIGYVSRKRIGRRKFTTILIVAIWN